MVSMPITVGTGLTTSSTTMSPPVVMPPTIPPQLLVVYTILLLSSTSSLSAQSTPLDNAYPLPMPKLTPLTLGMLISAPAIIPSSLLLYGV